MNKNGFSLMEVITVASIVGVIAAVALPNAENFFSSQHCASEVLTFIQDVRAARYGALSSQAYHRIFFQADPGGSVVISYVVQTYKNTGSISTAADITIARNNPDHDDWPSVLEVSRREIDPEVTFEKPAGLSVIFMRPDGLLVDQPNENGVPIGDYVATFTYGPSIMNANINANGVAGTSEYYEEY